MLRGLWIAVALASGMAAQQFNVSTAKIREHVKYLSSDALQGRGVATHGEELATRYIASQLRAEGVEPAGDNGTYFQRVPMVGVTTLPGSSLKATGGKVDLSFAPGKGFVGAPETQRPDNDFDAEAVFVGHGILAPEFGWDDYKGDNLRGKVLVYFTNEPPSEDPSFFGGRALTYYGRWTYKFEEAARQGAVAAIIIHTTPTAGYAWRVVSGSWGRELPRLKLTPGEPALKLAAWVPQDIGARLVANTGKNLDQLLAMANEKSFRPIPLGVHVQSHIKVKLRDIESRNVVGRVPGSDPEFASQAVIFSAHWDHLGVGALVNGDSIYNGAVDNATGCGMVLEMARNWAALPHKPKRTALFLFVTAEESGLLGSAYYAQNPVVPAGRTAVDINFDAFYPFGRTRDVSVTGAGRTTLWPLVQRDARMMNLKVEPDAEPEQGHYYRSDHFSFARAGVPAFSIAQGTDYIGKPAGFGKEIFEKYNAEHYHQPSDEYHADWDFSGMQQMADFGLRLGMDIANQPQLPTWHAGDEFLKAREKSGVSAGH